MGKKDSAAVSACFSRTAGRTPAPKARYREAPGSVKRRASRDSSSARVGKVSCGSVLETQSRDRHLQSFPEGCLRPARSRASAVPTFKTTLFPARSRNASCRRRAERGLGTAAKSPKIARFTAQNVPCWSGSCPWSCCGRSGSARTRRCAAAARRARRASCPSPATRTRCSSSRSWRR